MRLTRQVRPGAVVPVLAFGGIVVSLMQTVLIPLIPQLPTLLDASPADTAWAVTATLLAAAVAVPTVGRLGDMLGKRRMLLVSILLLIAGSVVVALSESLVPAIVGRALQGLASGVIPLGISIMRDELPQEKLGSATAAMSASLGVGGALGLPLSAFVAERADWHVLFWGAAGLGVVAGLLVLLLVPESPERTGGRVDVVGALGLSVVLLSLLLAVSKGADWGWASALTLSLFAVTLVVGALWVLWERRVRQPLVDLRTFAKPSVLFTNIASVVFGFALFAMSLVIPQLLQLPVETGYGLGRSMLDVGLVMAPSGLVMMAMAPVSARISARYGPKVTLMAASVVVALGYLLVMLLMTELWHFVLGSVVIGAGIGLGYGSMPALIMAAVPRSETASANSINTLMRSIGTSVSSAVAGVVLAHMTIDFAGTALPSTTGFRVVLGVAAGASLLALVVAAFIPTNRAAPAPAGRTITGRVGTGLVTVAAHTRDGRIVASGSTTDGTYRLQDLPAEPLLLVATPHPAVHEPVTVGAGHTRHDPTLRTDPA
jgi:MFS family permease